MAGGHFTGEELFQLAYVFEFDQLVAGEFAHEGLFNGKHVVDVGQGIPAISLMVVSSVKVNVSSLKTL